MLTVRQREILRILFQTGQTIPIQELSRVLQVSPRTLRYDLKDISYALKPQNLKVSVIPSQGVRIDDAQNLHWQTLFEQDVVQNQQTRLLTLLFHLLLSGKVSIGSMAKKFQMNRQTITRDVSALIQNGMLKSEDIDRTTHGLHCTLDQSHRMEVFCQWSVKNEFMNIALGEFEKNFPEVDDSVNAWIDQIESTCAVEFEEQSRKLLRIISAFAFIRTKENQTPNDILQQIFHSKQFGLAWDDAGYQRVELTLTSARLNKGVLPTEAYADQTDYLIDAFIEKLKLPIIAQDEAYRSLKMHLRAATHRSKSNQQADNPLKDDVRLSYSILYEAVSTIVKEFEERNELMFSEDEVAFIVMHIGAILQSQFHLQSNIAVAVVCQHGAATSNLLHSRLKQLMFNQRVLGPYSVKEYHDIKKEVNFDLVISTMALHDENVLVVNPLLNPKDIELIERRLWNILYQKQCDLLIKNFTVSHQQPISMHKLIKERHVQLAQRFDDWHKAIEFAAEPLLKDGVIEPRYVTKMIWAVESLGPYMVILPKIAFVHAGTEDGVLRNGISCLKLSHPLSFGNQKATDVQVIFVIASKAKEDTGLLKLVRILENQDNTIRLLNAKNHAEIMELEG